MADAYAFDMDGTLLDTERIWIAATVALLSEHDVLINDQQAVTLVYGRSWDDIYRDICTEYPCVSISYEDATNALRGHMLALRNATDCIIEGTVRLMHRLSAQAPVCVVSGSPRADVEEGVRLAGVDHLVAFVLGAEDYTPGKPDPACYRLAAMRLGVQPERCTAFEDSTAGVTAAHTAGLYTVALARQGVPAQDFSLAHEVLADLAGFVPSGTKS